MAVGSDGIIMVDGQFAPLHDKIKAAIAAISPLPMKYLINARFHGDHTGGNEAYSRFHALSWWMRSYRTRLHRLNSLLTGKTTGNLAKTGFRCRF